VIVCPRCSKENQDHYKFCLGCGAELPRDAAHAPKSFTAPTPAAGLPVAAPGAGFGAQGGFGAPAPAPGFGAPAAGFGAPAPAAGFGAPAPAAGFGAPAPAAGFGAPAPAPGFGAPAAGFGAPAPAPAAGFGAPAPGFGAPAAGGFGAPAQAPGFGAPPAQAKPAQFGGAAAAAAAPQKCPQCATMVPPGFKFCGTCGHDMTAIAAAASAPTAPAPRPGPPVAAAGASRGMLTLIRPDGSEGDVFPLQEMTVIGRDAGGPFATDSYLSPRHAVFTFRSDGLSVADQNSLNGIYVRIERDVPHELEPGAIFRVGQEILRFDPIPAPARGPDGVELMGSPNPGFLGKISLLIGRETTGNAFPIPPGGMHLGRERGDIIFPEDGYVSGLHCRIHSEGGKVVLTDVGSSNGTFTRVRGERSIKRGSLLLMGQQLFRADY
jgi:pSer/pThr/pTyr-binding forkhead associated (FHA) protein